MTAGSQVKVSESAEKVCLEQTILPPTTQAAPQFDFQRSPVISVNV